MQQLDQFQSMLNELQRCRINVKKQINEFKVLQNEISELHKKADKDPIALRKLAKFNDVMQSDIGAEKIIKKSEEVKLIFNQLSKQFKQLSVENTGQNRDLFSSEKNKSVVKKQYRTFV
nr:hypothetical protein [Providencia rettgeri]